jgi:hypothetical protein
MAALRLPPPQDFQNQDPLGLESPLRLVRNSGHTDDGACGVADEIQLQMIIERLDEIRNDVSAIRTDQISLGGRVGKLENHREAEVARDIERKEFSQQLERAYAATRDADAAARKALAEDVSSLKETRTNMAGRAWVLGGAGAAILMLAVAGLGAWVTVKGEQANKQADAKAEQAAKQAEMQAKAVAAEVRAQTISILSSYGVKIPPEALGLPPEAPTSHE